MRILLLVLLLFSGLAQAAPSLSALSPHRSTGNVPLYVHLNLSATDAAVSNTFLELDYVCSFGDDSAGNWSYGATGESKNIGRGPVVAHVYETAGTYTINCKVTNHVTGLSDFKSTTITASDWPNDTTTICVSTGTAPTAGANGCPSGAAVKGSVSSPNSAFQLLVAGTDCSSGTAPCDRVLLKRGDTFTGASPAALSGTGKMLGAFGLTGGKPVLTTSATGAGSAIFTASGSPTDLRLVDLDIDGNETTSGVRVFMVGGAGTITNLTMLRVDIHDIGCGIDLDASLVVAISGIVFQDSTIYDIVSAGGATCPIGIRFADTTNGAILGNDFNRSTVSNAEHMIRTGQVDNFILSHNTVANVKSGKEMISLRTDAGTTTRYAIIADNKVNQNTGTGIQLVYVTPDDTGSQIQDVIVERNAVFFTSGGDNPSMYRVDLGTDVVLRNNVGRTNSTTTYFFRLEENAGTAPDPSNIYLYNNSMYMDGTGTGHVGIYVEAAVTGVTAKNNIIYSVNGGTLISGADTTSNNSTTITTSPSFATTPPTDYSHFFISTGSYANGGGAAVSMVACDFLCCVDTGGTPPMGAFVPRAEAICLGIR